MPRRISRDVAREILDRAARHQHTERSELTLAELRMAAFEAGISQDSLERALGELSPMGEVELVRRETVVEVYTRWLLRVLPGWTRSALVGAAGFVWGMLTRLVERLGSEEPMIAMFTAIAPAVLMLVMHHRRRGSMLGFQEDLLAFFAAYLGAVLLLPDTIWSIRNVFVLTGSVWATSVLVGGALLLLPDRALPVETQGES